MKKRMYIYTDTRTTYDDDNDYYYYIIIQASANGGLGKKHTKCVTGHHPVWKFTQASICIWANKIKWFSYYHYIIMFYYYHTFIIIIIFNCWKIAVVVKLFYHFSFSSSPFVYMWYNGSRPFIIIVIIISHSVMQI